jgi:hypothetical protein
MDDAAYKDLEIASSDAQSAHDDGTTAQGQLGKAQARRNFFASLDATVAEAVKSDAERVKYTEEEEVSTLLSVKFCC